MASSESDPCVRKTGYCPWTGWEQDLCFRILQHNFLPCAAFVLCLKRRIKGYFYSMALCRGGWHGVSLNSPLPLLGLCGPPCPCFILTPALMGVFHALVCYLGTQLLGVLWNEVSEKVVISRSLLVVCSEARLC